MFHEVGSAKNDPGILGRDNEILWEGKEKPTYRDDNEIILVAPEKRKPTVDYTGFKDYMDEMFGFGKADKGRDASETEETGDAEADLEQTVDEYIGDLKDKSECPETIPDRPFEASDLEKLSPEETARRREEFDDVKGDLKRQWEAEHGRPWPKYDHDVLSANGRPIRKAGNDYDAHHIQPLGMGGKNEAKNITPLNAEVHYDKQGVHAPDSPYNKIEKMLGGAGS